MVTVHKSSFVICSLLALCIYGLGPLHAEDSKLSLDEFVEWTVDHHPFVDSLSMAWEQEMAAWKQLRAQEAWTLSNQTSYTAAKPVQLSSFTPDYQNVTEVDISLSRPLWGFGGTLSGGYDYSYTDLKYPELGFDLGAEKYHEHSFSLEYRQSLLKNRGGLNDRLAVDLKEFELARLKLQYQEEYEAFILGAEKQYLNWRFLYQQTQIATERLDLARQALSQSKELFDAGVIDKIDWLRANYAARSAQEQYQLAVTDFDAETQRLVTLYDWDRYELPEPAPVVYVPLPPEQSEGRSRLLQLHHLDIDQLRRAEASYEDALRPDIDVVLSQTFSSAAEGFGNSTDFDRPTSYIALDITETFGKEAERAQLDQNQRAIRAAELRKDAEYRQLEAARKQGMTRLQSLYEILLLNQEQLNLAEAEQEEEAALYAQGRSQLLTLIQTQDQLAARLLSYAQLLRDYLSQRAEYLALLDVLPVPERESLDWMEDAE